MPATIRPLPRFLSTVLALAAVALLGLACGCSRSSRKPADSISAADREVLVQYEAMRAALAADNSGKAHVAAVKLLKAAEASGVSPEIDKLLPSLRIMAESYKLDVQRGTFKELSKALVPICRGVEGYYIVSTDLLPDGLWVQTTREVDNPYLGRSMALYGEVVK